VILRGGERSSAGRASVCGTEGRGFKSHRSPQTFPRNLSVLEAFTVLASFGIRIFANRSSFPLRFGYCMRVSGESDARVRVSQLGLHRGWCCSQINPERAGRVPEYVKARTRDLESVENRPQLALYHFICGMRLSGASDEEQAAGFGFHSRRYALRTPQRASGMGTVRIADLLFGACSRPYHAL
jgi:hypothetical protein